MKTTLARTLLALLALLAATLAWSHAMPSSAVLLKLYEHEIDAELRLPIDRLSIGFGTDLGDVPGEVIPRFGPQLGNYVLEHVRPVTPDGRPWTVVVQGMATTTERIPDLVVRLKMTPPPGAPVDRLAFGYSVITHQLVTHSAIVSLVDGRKGGDAKPVLVGTIRDKNLAVAIDRARPGPLANLAAMFRLGAKHIAEGTDHLLFVLALLLPAPLVATGGHWGGFAGGRLALRRIAKVVTAFTVGHSVTLLLGALGWVHLPTVFVESAIALSILVSAIHALTPVFRGREAVIAGGFGLVHGLSFAAVLGGFGFDTPTVVAGVLGFNLGIETFQFLVIVVAMPWLVLLAQTRAYLAFRVAGALVTGLAAATWLGERALGLRNPVGPVVEAVAAHTPLVVVGLAAFSVLAYSAPRLRSHTPLAGASR